MNAWLKDTATYVPFKVELVLVAHSIDHTWRRMMVDIATKELGGVPTDWHWEQEGASAFIAAARRL